MGLQIHSRWVWIALGAIIALTAGIRIRLLALPLERDEGEYAYTGQLILQGIPPYAEVYNMKLPGIYAAYAGILLIFGQTPSGIHAGLLAVNILTILALFGLANRLFGSFVGVAAGGAFAILSLSQRVFGTFAHAEHFVILPAIAGIWLLVHGIDSRKNLFVFCAAILLGLAFIMKQHGLAFVLFGGLYLVFRMILCRPFNWKDFLLKSGLFAVGAGIPFAATCLILWRCGVFEKFWFWTFDYAKEYVSQAPFEYGMNELEKQINLIAGSAILIWLFAATGVVALFSNKNFRKHSFFAVGFLAFSFLAICPGLYFRQHYFILLLPAIAIFAGVGLSQAIEFVGRSKQFVILKIVSVLIIMAVLLYSLYQQRQFFFVKSPAVISREIYETNAFAESLKIAKYLKEHSTENDRIAILGSEPQIFFYAHRRSATSYIYTYPLMELHSYALKMQQDMIREIETAQPRFIVFMRIPTSWLPHPQSDLFILKWFDKYSASHYNLVGVIEISSDGTPFYRWGQLKGKVQPQSDYWIGVFEKKSYQVTTIPRG
jgi:hypothetical protein